jgi:hypothetical protein
MWERRFRTDLQRKLKELDQPFRSSKEGLRGDAGRGAEDVLEFLLSYEKKGGR